MKSLSRGQVSDAIHGVVVVLVCVMATVYATVAQDHSNNIWIIYGSSVAYAAGRAGASVASTMLNGRRPEDAPGPKLTPADPALAPTEIGGGQ